MQLEQYPAIVSDNSTMYEFFSEGKRGVVAKLVMYSKTHWVNIFNLGFGDKNLITGGIDDMVITNNGDSEKVLATVAATLYVFTDQYPEAMVFAMGSNKVRTRLYRIGISNNLKLIENDFEVFGYVGDGWQVFEKQVDYESFLVKRKKK